MQAFSWKNILYHDVFFDRLQPAGYYFCLHHAKIETFFLTLIVARQAFLRNYKDVVPAKQALLFFAGLDELVPHLQLGGSTREAEP